MISLGVTLATAMTVGMIAQDNVALKAASNPVAARSATLWKGDWVEVRGEQQGYWKVYDHRHERPGYVRQGELRTYALDESNASRFFAIVEFLRDQPGGESLGIAYAAMYLKVAQPKDVGTTVFDALGTMADRLARTASARRSASLPGVEAAIAGQVEVAESYGVKFVRFDSSSGTARTCYDGETFTHVLQMNGAPEEMARAALGLTRPECVDPAAPAIETLPRIEKQLATLDRAAKVVPYPSVMSNRIAMRKASVMASYAFLLEKKGDHERASAAADGAMKAIALVDRIMLADDEVGAYDAAATRVATVRWATELAPKRTKNVITTKPGRAGETCLFVDDTAVACTYGVVWTASARHEIHGRAIAINVQPLDGWSELWILKPSEAGWQVTPLVPAPTDPDLGYVELAGWQPDGTKLMVAKESRQKGVIVRDFQLLTMGTLGVEKQAHTANLLLSFQKFASVEWRTRTLALRGQELARR